MVRVDPPTDVTENGSGSEPHVLVMQAADVGSRDNPAGLGWLHRPVVGGVLVER